MRKAQIIILILNIIAVLYFTSLLIRFSYVIPFISWHTWVIYILGILDIPWLLWNIITGR